MLLPDLLAMRPRGGHKVLVAIVIELLIPLAVVGLIGWGLWLWYRLKLARAEETERMQEELTELRAYKRDTEARLQALETIATLGEGRVRVDYKGVPEDDDEARKRKG
jgi:Tfp pilus assembly protein PilO